MNINKFSKSYSVRQLDDKDIEMIYKLCEGNPLYYEYCPPMVTLENIHQDMVSLQ